MWIGQLQWIDQGCISKCCRLLGPQVPAGSLFFLTCKVFLARLLPFKALNTVNAQTCRTRTAVLTVDVVPPKSFSSRRSCIVDMFQKMPWWSSHLLKHIAVQVHHRRKEFCRDNMYCELSVWSVKQFLARSVDSYSRSLYQNMKMLKHWQPSWNSQAIARATSFDSHV